MQSKEIIDYQHIDRKIGTLKDEVQQVYNKVTTIYREEQEKLPGGSIAP